MYKEAITLNCTRYSNLWKSILKLDTQETRKTHLESASTRSTLRSMLCSIQSLQSIHSIPSTWFYMYIVYIYICYIPRRMESGTRAFVYGHMCLCAFVCLSSSFSYVFILCMYPRNRVHCDWSSYSIYTRCVPASLGSYGYTYLIRVVFLWPQVTRAYKIIKESVGSVEFVQEHLGAF